METIGILLELLQKKKELFLEFELRTEEMLSCPADDLEGLLRIRGNLIEKIDSINLKVTGISEKMDRQTQAALSNEGYQGDLPEPLRQVYNAAAQIKAIVSRMAELEVQAAMRLRLEQENTLKLIKATNKGVSAQAAKFLSAADVAGRPPAHRSEA